MLTPGQYRQYQLFHYGRVLNHDDTVQATSLMTKQDFIRTSELWQELYQERYSSQELNWAGLFVLTPEKLCAGVCFPPYGIYLIWKSWKSKKKLRRLTKGEKKRQKDLLSAMASREAELAAAAAAGTTGTKTKAGQQQELLADGVGPSRQLAGSPPLEEQGEEGESSNEKSDHFEEVTDEKRPSPTLDAKGKGKMDENASLDGNSASGSESSMTKSNNHADSLHRTPALGLDGRFSNWNDEALGPDG